MASPSVTYTFVNSTTADAAQVNQNFADIIAGMTDGSKDFNINALTCAGTATLNGNSVIGNASGDASTVNATMSFATTPLVDTINEKTSTAGVVIKGRSSGAAIAAGYVGEVLESSGTTTTTTITNLCSVVLTAGSWEIHCNVVADFSSTGAGDYVDFALSTANNNITGAISISARTLGISKGQFSAAGAGRGSGSSCASLNTTGITLYLNSSFSGTGPVVGSIKAFRRA